MYVYNTDRYVELHRFSYIIQFVQTHKRPTISTITTSTAAAAAAADRSIDNIYIYKRRLVYRHENDSATLQLLCVHNIYYVSRVPVCMLHCCCIGHNYNTSSRIWGKGFFFYNGRAHEFSGRPHDNKRIILAFYVCRK